MEVMQEGRLIYWNFVKWQFCGCKFRRQFCQLCVTSQKTAETLTLTQSCEFLCRNALFCKEQSLFLRVNCNYMWWKEASQAWLLLTIILYFFGTKNKNKKQKHTSRGRSLPITYCIPFFSFPKMLSWQLQQTEKILSLSYIFKRVIKPFLRIRQDAT